MALDTYANLQTSIGTWLNRSDLTAQIPDFITLAETEIKRRIRRLTLRATLTISAEFTALPSDCAELRSIRLSSGDPVNDVPIIIVTSEQLSEYRATWAAVAARPQWATVYNNAIQMAPAPDQAYTAVITYYQALQPLGPSRATNTVLTEYPDLYLFGALMQGAPYLENDERIPVWERKFEKAIDQINIVVDREEYGASIKQVRLPRVF